MLNLSNGRPPPLFLEGSSKLTVTLKFHKNRGFADCSPHRDRTVRHSKPTARTAMIACQSRPLEPRADSPHPWGGPSAVQNFEPTDLQTSLIKSGSDRRSKSEHTQKPQCFYPRIFSRRRTIRSTIWTPKTELPSFCARFSF